MTKKTLVSFAVSIAMALVNGSALAGDPVKGGKVFSKCAACHTIKKDGKQGVGPNLFGVVGRKAGSVQGFRRYAGLKGAEFVWDEPTLDAWLSNPKEFIKERSGGKTSMKIKLRKANQRDDVIAYLGTLR